MILLCVDSQACENPIYRCGLFPNHASAVALDWLAGDELGAETGIAVLVLMATTWLRDDK